MTNKPNYSLKDLLNELKEKEKGCGTYLYDSDFEDLQDLFEHRVDCGVQEVITGEMQYCKTCQAEISALKKGIQACEEILNSQQNKNKYHSERLLLRETEKTGSADTQEKVSGVSKNNSEKSPVLIYTDTVNNTVKPKLFDELLLETAKNNFEKGRQFERDKILEKMNKIKIRKCCSYPTMLRHHYISQRDFEELKQSINQSLTGEKE